MTPTATVQKDLKEKNVQPEARETFQGIEFTSNHTICHFLLLEMTPTATTFQKEAAGSAFDECMFCSTTKAPSGLLMPSICFRKMTQRPTQDSKW
jgi:hypothetical protein